MYPINLWCQIHNHTHVRLHLSCCMYDVITRTRPLWHNVVAMLHSGVLPWRRVVQDEGEHCPSLRTRRSVDAQLNIRVRGGGMLEGVADAMSTIRLHKFSSIKRVMSGMVTLICRPAMSSLMKVCRLTSCSEEVSQC